MPDLTIRRAGPDDAAVVREITLEAYQKWIGVLGREPKPMTADYESAVRHHVIDLAVANGEITGLVEMIPGDGHLLIENVAVRPAHQSQGLGKILVAHAETIARHLGYSLVKLYTNKLFSTNLRFYASLGYTVDREEEYKGGFVVHLSKPV